MEWDRDGGVEGQRFIQHRFWTRQTLWGAYRDVWKLLLLTRKYVKTTSLERRYERVYYV